MTLPLTSPSGVTWQPWDAAAFERARIEGRPILLSIVTDWCAACREMDRTTYADPAICADLNERLVAVRVDADRRPDISERYSLGGWPTTVFLNADGELLGGGTFVPAERMRQAIPRLLALAGHPADVRRASSRPAPELPAEPIPDPEQLTALVFEAAASDRNRPGPWFPFDAPVRLALSRWRAGHEPHLERFVTTMLDDLGWGRLHDERHGGFFRSGSGPGWESTDTAKLLTVNAAMLRLYLEAGEALAASRFIDRAADIVRYVQQWLADAPDGGWFAAQRADAAYYASDAGGSAPPPEVSRICYADANGLMVSAMLHAARVFDDDGLGAFAIQSLERILLSCYRPGDGVAHFTSGGTREVPGLFADQVAMAEACLDAFEVTGNVVYEMMAEELMHFALRRLWSEATGAFADRAPEPGDRGRLRDRVEPFVANCDAAMVLERLAASSGTHEFAQAAARVRAAMASRAARYGELAAHYLLSLPRATVR